MSLLHAVYAGRPQAGHDPVAFGNWFYDRQHARVIAGAGQELRTAAGSGHTVRELRVLNTAGQRLVWYWYCVDGRCTASAAGVKLLQTWQVVRGVSPRVSVWALSVPSRDGHQAQARQRLRDFAQALSTAGGGAR